MGIGLAPSWTMRVVRSSGFTLVEVVVASAVTAVLMAGVLTAASAVAVQLRESERLWKVTDAVSQVLDQSRAVDATQMHDLNGRRLSVDDTGAVTASEADATTVWTVILRTSQPSGWPPATMRIEACAYRGPAEGDEPAVLCLESGVQGAL